MLDKKKKLLEKAMQKNLWHQHEIEDDIGKIIDSLCSEDDYDMKSKLDFEPKVVDKKVDVSMTNLTKQKIKNNVRGYFIFIKDKLTKVDEENPGAADLIALQIKEYYLKQKQIDSNQEQIYFNIVSWINAKCKPSSDFAADILVSFFVQNCEVFE